MAASTQLSRVHAFSSLFLSPPTKPLSLPFSIPSSSPLPSFRSLSLPQRRRNVFPRRATSASFVASALGKLSEAELVSIPEGDEGLEGKIPAGPGVYGIHDKNGELQFIGTSRNAAASVAIHRKAVPDLCGSVKVGLVDDTDRMVLTNAWKSWMEEHLAATGKIPPGNETGNNTWFRQPQKKPDLRLTPGRNTQLTVSFEELIDQLVKEHKIVAFIKGSRYAPQCGFSQRVVGILESQGVDFECVNVLDEEYNYGLRETLKIYSNWPTFPQVFVRGELLGGCDILSSMEEKGELAKLLKI